MGFFGFEPKLDGLLAHWLHLSDERIVKEQAAVPTKTTDTRDAESAPRPETSGAGVGGRAWQLVQQLVTEVTERVALFEKLSDLEQFDFHRGCLRKNQNAVRSLPNPRGAAGRR